MSVPTGSSQRAQNSQFWQTKPQRMIASLLLRVKTLDKVLNRDTWSRHGAFPSTSLQLLTKASEINLSLGRSPRAVHGYPRLSRSPPAPPPSASTAPSPVPAATHRQPPTEKLFRAARRGSAHRGPTERNGAGAHAPRPPQPRRAGRPQRGHRPHRSYRAGGKWGRGRGGGSYRRASALLAERSPEDAFDAAVVPVAEVPGADDQVARHAGPPGGRARGGSAAGLLRGGGAGSAGAEARMKERAEPQQRSPRSRLIQRPGERCQQQDALKAAAGRAHLRERGGQSACCSAGGRRAGQKKGRAQLAQSAAATALPPLPPQTRPPAADIRRGVSPRQLERRLLPMAVPSAGPGAGCSRAPRTVPAAPLLPYGRRSRRCASPHLRRRGGGGGARGAEEG